MHALELPCADQLVGDDGRGAVAAQAVLAASVKQAQGETMRRSEWDVLAELLVSSYGAC